MKNNKNNSLITMTFLSFILSQSITAQDKITLRNGDEINAKVLEVTDSQIRYKPFDNLEGPMHIINKSETFIVKYENGSKDVFNTNPEGNKTEHTIVQSNSKFDKDSSDYANVKEKRFTGPRIGLTYVSSGTAANYLASQGKQPLITQFGWQFERRLFTVDNGTSGIVEFVPMVGGLEQGMFIPSASFLIGLRGGEKRTFEFAMGPNFSVVPNYLGQREASMGVVIAAGTNFKMGNVNFPVNIAVVPSIGSKHDVFDAATNTTSKQTFQTGWRLSLVVGFNSRKK